MPVSERRVKARAPKQRIVPPTADSYDPKAMPVKTAAPRGTRWYRSMICGVFTLIWCTTILVACYLNYTDEQQIPRKVKHPLSSFDKQLRKNGPLFPLAIFAVRFLMDLADRMFSADRRAGRGSMYMQNFVALGVYLAATGLRIALYLHGRKHAPDHMSDHIFLGASMYAITISEVVFMLEGGVAAVGHRGGGGVGSAAAPAEPGAGQIALKAVKRRILVGIVLFAGCLAGDMFYTARYYHRVQENLLSLAAGTVVFQLPVSVWIMLRS